jgi:hypothetical protein
VTEIREIPKSEWKWFGNAGHLIVSRWCRFHLCTLIGDYVVSTVGEYWPERQVREIHAEVHDPAWLTANRHLKGDTFDAEYFKRFGYEEIGYHRKYETMVFRVIGFCEAAECGCGLPDIDGSEHEVDGYNNAKDATEGHMAMCEKWAIQPRPTEITA